MTGIFHAPAINKHQFKRSQVKYQSIEIDIIRSVNYIGQINSRICCELPLIPHQINSSDAIFKHIKQKLLFTWLEDGVVTDLLEMFVLRGRAPGLERLDGTVNCS